MKKIKNIIFDLGRVILPIAPELTINEFNNLGINNVAEMIAGTHPNNLFIDYEKGKVSSDKFIDEISSLCNIKVSKNRISEIWNLMLLDFDIDTISLIQNLSMTYRIFLLSNTNDIHLKYFTSRFYERFNFQFNEIFEKTYYSHLMNDRKPNLSIYHTVIKEQNINPTETLFLDDNLINLTAAQSIGINIQEINDSYTLIDHFKH